MTKVCIYRPTKTAMQSGRAQTRDWVLEFDAAAPKEKEPLMGWTSCRDTRTQVALRFQTKEAAGGGIILLSRKLFHYIRAGIAQLGR